MLVPTVLAKTPEPKKETLWCFSQQFNSKEEYQLVRKLDHTNKFDSVLVKPNGSKLKVFTKCDPTTLPYPTTSLHKSYSPTAI